MYQPRNGFFADFENSSEQCGFGVHLVYSTEENCVMIGLQFLTLQFILGYDFTPID